jgi:hypothetical protein
VAQRHLHRQPRRHGEQPRLLIGGLDDPRQKIPPARWRRWPPTQLEGRVGEPGVARITVAATFDDDLSLILDDARYNADARVTVGVLTYARPTLSWSSGLEPGRSTTVTYSIRILAARQRRHSPSERGPAHPPK